MSGELRPACASTLRIAVMKPADRSPGVDGVLATHVAPVAASASVMSVNVPPTSMAIVPVADMAAIVDDPGGGRRSMSWRGLFEIEDVAGRVGRREGKASSDQGGPL